MISGPVGPRLGGWIRGTEVVPSTVSKIAAESAGLVNQPGRS